MKAVDPKFTEAAHRVQQMHAAPHRASALVPVLVPLAEFRFLGHTLDVMLEFLAAVDIPYTRSPLSAWLRANVGAESGAGSRAEKIVQEAVNAGLYESSHFKPQGSDGFRQQSTNEFDSEISRPRNSSEKTELETPVAATAPKFAPITKDENKPSPTAAVEVKPAQIPTSTRVAEDKEEERRLRHKLRDKALAELKNPFERIQEKDRAEAPAKNVDEPAAKSIINSDAVVEVMVPVTDDPRPSVKGAKIPEELDKEEAKRKRRELLNKGLESLMSPFERIQQRNQKDRNE